MTKDEALTYLAKNMAEVLEYEFYSVEAQAEPMAVAMSLATAQVWEVVKIDIAGRTQYAVQPLALDRRDT